MSNETAPTSAIDVFVKRRLITEVLEAVKSGKEATVYRCRAHPDTGRRFIAAKVHRPIEIRAFRNDALYQQGRVIRESRWARAFAARSAFGLRVQSDLWVSSEWRTLRLLHRCRASVPEPIARCERVILMEWIGDDEPAPPLRRVRFSTQEARRCLDALLEQVALWLVNDRVHGDLSAFNVLWHDGGPVAIDFPQAVDPRENANARALWHVISATSPPTSRATGSRWRWRRSSRSGGGSGCGGRRGDAAAAHLRRLPRRERLLSPLRQPPACLRQMPGRSPRSPASSPPRGRACRCRAWERRRP